VEKNFHKLVYYCPDCEQSVTILNFHARSDGVLMIEGICAPCGSQLEVETSLQLIIVTCLELDVFYGYEKEMEEL
jgi:hypothetical protein